MLCQCFAISIACIHCDPRLPPDYELLEVKCQRIAKWLQFLSASILVSEFQPLQPSGLAVLVLEKFQRGLIMKRPCLHGCLKSAT